MFSYYGRGFDKAVFSFGLSAEFVWVSYKSKRGYKMGIRKEYGVGEERRG